MTIAAILAAKGAHVATIGPDATIAAAAGQLGAHRIGAIPVVAGHQILGILSERDIVAALPARGAALLDQRVESLMSAPAITCRPEDGVLAALARMTDKRIRHLPVVDVAGRLVGIVSIGDLVKHRISRFEREADEMRAYIQSV